KTYNVTDVVRVCDPTYNAEFFERENIQVWDWPFGDGEAPPQRIISDWLALVARRFKDNKNATIAIHCVAGLGRAPVLVAIALIESGMEAEDAVEIIRRARRGAINSKQLVFLRKYKPQRKKLFCDCVIC
ncbi:protein tyrosine phosphatase type IVA 3-like, partial [Zophobas morio]|uniref:protein tyrosine phosphatase type IVA 3-like n=1 Tax=Zophobas morio TaxID=2755281 RepID=UPI003083753F